jgi:hypothetical protein
MADSFMARGDSLGEEIWYGCIPLQRSLKCSKLWSTAYFAGKCELFLTQLQFS